MTIENNLTFIGNVVDEVQLRFTNSGVPVSQFRMAVNKRVYDKATNQWQDGPSTFLSVNCWRSMGENVAETVSKGQRVVVIGTLEQRQYTNKDGQNVTVYEILADEVAPSLKFAVGQMQRSNNSGNAGPNQGGGQNFNGGGQYTGSATDIQRHSAAEDPWNSAPNAGFDNADEAPF